jgi:hypothetical protein
MDARSLKFISQRGAANNFIVAECAAGKYGVPQAFALA